jgi:1,4-dihydroxy-2-naphthoyl-CoA hydrolase
VSNLLDRLRENMPPMSKLLGVELIEASRDRIVAEMLVREDMGNGSGILHGGGYMTFADYLGAIGTVLNLPRGMVTTTIESKTNFFAPALIGTRVRGESLPLHRGRRTNVWQTRLTNPDGKLLAMVTQTQMIMEPPKPASHDSGGGEAAKG